MYHVFSCKCVKIRKKRQCFGCARIFDIGTEMECQKQADGGTICSTYLCPTCTKLEHELYRGEDLYFGVLRDEALEMEAKPNE